MTTDIGSVVALSLPREIVRTVFPVSGTLTSPDLSDIPGLTPRWNQSAAPGTPVTVSDSFSATAPGYDYPYVSDPGSYSAYTPEQIAVIENVLAAYSAVCGITFVRLEDPAAAQMVYRKSSTLDATGRAGYPGASVEAGDLVILTSAAGQPYITFHETGHALGIAHTFDTNKPIPEDYGIPGGRLLSVVDQRSVPKPYYLLSTGGGGITLGSIFHPETPMPLDILALQMMYGQNTTTNAGNTVYTYDVNPNFFRTIWDAGGIDTIDLSNQVNPNLITLVQGTYSTIGLRDPFAGWDQFAINFALANRPAEQFNDGTNSLAIAFDAVIENAVGGSADDRIIGNAADNRLTGGAGSDTLDGGAGRDTAVYANNAAAYTVTQQGNGTVTVQGLDGTDTLISIHFVQFNDRTITVASGTLVGTSGPDSLTGDDGPETITGLGGNDTLGGGPGNDSLDGGAGNDMLDGGSGNDTLNGGSGVDQMSGGAGNDIYITNNSSDVATENANEGTDRVQSGGASHTLGANVEHLTLTGSAANGTGNSLNNVITGNSIINTLAGGSGNDSLDGGSGNDTLGGGSGNDTLNGGLGIDRMSGGSGNDIYVANNSSDVATENASSGTDHVQAGGASYTLGANVERLTLTGSAGNGTGNSLNNAITGNSIANQLTGGSGNDTLAGGLGNDTLAGGSGNDRFLFDTVLNGSTNVDRISDFNAVADALRLDDVVFTGLALGTLSSSAFRRGTQAGDSSDRIIYNATTGAVLFDSDGSGAAAAVRFATLSAGLAITNSDFIVV